MIIINTIIFLISFSNNKQLLKYHNINLFKIKKLY